MQHAGSRAGFSRSRRSLLCLVLVVAAAGVLAPAGAATVILNEYNAMEVGNGGDWFELVVVGDGTAGGTVDMSNWYVTIRTDGAAAGTLRLNTEAFWSAVQNGTILTFTEDNTAGGGRDTGIGIVDEFATQGYGWSNFHIGGGTYFAAGSSVSMMGGDTHKDTQFTIRNAFNTLVFGPAGEGVAPASGVGSDEVFKLEKDPSPAITETDDGYNDGSSSTFGAPNSWSGGANTQNFNAFNTSAAPSDLKWDVVAGNTTTTDGAGTWSGGTGNWYNAAEAKDDIWDSTQPDSATFGSGGVGAHVVTLSGAVTAGDLTFVPGPLYTLTGGPLTVRGNLTANVSAVINSDLTLTSTGARVEVAADKTLTIGGQLLGSDDFEVGGEGTVVLSADNSAFDDTITVTNDVTLEVNGNLSPSGLVHVKSEAALVVGPGATIGNVLVDSGSKVRIEGQGTLAGGLIMDDNDAKVRGTLTVVDKVEILEGIISPGESNSPGLLAFGVGTAGDPKDLVLGPDVTYTWQLFDNTDAGAGVNFDQVTVGDQLKADEPNPADPDYTQLLVNIEMRDLVAMSNAFWNANRTWVIIDVARADNFTADMLDLGTVLDVDETPLAQAAMFAVALDGSDVVVTYTVPEPCTAVLLIGGGLALLRRRRRAA